jgi:hypothetical protein
VLLTRVHRPNGWTGNLARSSKLLANCENF